MNEKYLLKLQEDLRLKNFTKNTCDDYYRFVKRFLDFTGMEAMSITYADIRKFIFHMKDNESKKASTINVYTAAIRFFFEYTLGYVWDSKKIPKMKRDRQLPVILTREQVEMLINSMDNYKHKAITATMYSSGLRVSEVCHLRYEDIRRSQKMIHVPLSKNRQDRYTILSDRNLEILTEYWYRYNRPMGWLFPSTVRDEPLTTSTVERFIKNHAQALGLPEGVVYLLVCHCVERVQRRFGEGRRPGMKQIEKEGYAWARMGIDTQSAADAYLRAYARRQGALPQYMRALQLGDRYPAPSEEKYLLSWQEMGFPPEAVALAYDKTMLKCHELKWAYCNGILKRWHEAGLHTAEEIQAGDRPAARRAEGQLSGDTDREMRRYMQDLHRNRR